MPNLTKQEREQLKQEDPALVEIVSTKGDSLVKCQLCHSIIRVSDTRDDLCIDCKPLKTLMKRYSNPSHPLTDVERERILRNNKSSGSRTYGK